MSNPQSIGKILVSFWGENLMELRIKETTLPQENREKRLLFRYPSGGWSSY